MMASADSLEDDFVIEAEPKSSKRKAEDLTEDDDDQEVNANLIKRAKTWRSFKERVFEDAGLKEYIPEDIPDDRSIPSMSSFVDSSELTLPSVTKFNFFQVREKSKRVIIVTPSAERAIAIIPQLKKTAKVAKLFARHMKVAEQERYLKKKKDVNVCIGTPNRFELIDALSLDNVDYIILDGSKDQKDRTIFNFKELEADVLQILKMAQSGQKVIVF
ncbi:U3-containing 90S pre-ribosomal complex subunit-domain containing protein [Chytridium lagenaria]|nr:U3-containing 90S pre-ribosomal complex subunit-domain containing protein [Chytridium lagenaria]